MSHAVGGTAFSTVTVYMGGSASLIGELEAVGRKVEAVRLFDGTTLIASKDAAEQGAGVRPPGP